jgi:hypothetical protein
VKIPEFEDIITGMDEIKAEIEEDLKPRSGTVRNFTVRRAVF